MKRRILFVLLAVLAVAIPVYALTINQLPSKGTIPYLDNGDGTFTAQGTTITTTPSGTQAVSMSDRSSVDTGLLTDTIQMDSGTINPYTEITKTYTNVKWIQAKARTGIDVRVSTGTGSSTSTTYDIISAGERWKVSNLHAIASLVVKFMGNSATSSDTGIIQITYGQ